MNDNKEITRLALLRAEEIKADRRRVHRFVGSVGTIFTACLVVLLVVI